MLYITSLQEQNSFLFDVVFGLQNSTFQVSSEKLLRIILCQEYGLWNGKNCNSPSHPLIPPGQRKIFYGPHNKFTSGVATHLADNLGITRKGEQLEIIPQKH